MPRKRTPRNGKSGDGRLSLILSIECSKVEIEVNPVVYSEEHVKRITEIVRTMSKHIYIDKTSIENQAFPMYQEFLKNPKGKLKALIPVFQWLNFEVPNV